MTVTADSTFLVAPGGSRIGRDAFARVLRERAAPGVVAERDPAAYYDVIVSTTHPDGRHVDPLLMLAIFQHESTMGRYGVAVQTHSWGNTRKPSFGAAAIGEVPGRTGTFPVFRDWLDGCISTAARLVTPEWVYSGPSTHPQTKQQYPPRSAIRELFEHPSTLVWAPAGDLNDPKGYLRAVLDFMNAHADAGEEPPAVPFTIHRSLLPDGASNKPNRLMVPTWITIHETANPNPGATAAMHAQWLQNLAKQGAGEPSWHFTVDEREAYQHLRLDEMGWHAGDGANGTGNRESIGIELCVNQGADFGRTLANAAGLVRDLMQRYGIPRERVVQHNHWSGKNCPATIRRTPGLWESFLDALDDPAPAPPARDPMADIVADPWGRANPWGTFYTPRVFAADMIANGLAATGHLVSGMFLEDGRAVQYTERARLEWNPDPKHPAGGYVTRELLGLVVLGQRHPDRDPRRAA